MLAAMEHLTILLALLGNLHGRLPYQGGLQNSTDQLHRSLAPFLSSEQNTTRRRSGWEGVQGPRGTVEYEPCPCIAQGLTEAHEAPKQTASGQIGAFQPLNN